MPTYEYVCVKCGEQFVRLMSLKDYEAGQVACPKWNAATFQHQKIVRAVSCLTRSSAPPTKPSPKGQ